MKVAGPGMGYLLTSCCSRRVKKSPKQHRLLTLFLVVHHNYMVRTYCWVLGHKSNLIPKWEISSLLASFQSVQCYNAGCWGRRDTNSLIQCWTLLVKAPTCRPRSTRWSTSACDWDNQVLSYCVCSLHQREFSDCCYNLGQKPMAGNLEIQLANLLLIFN